jgi:hypothetical protein
MTAKNRQILGGAITIAAVALMLVDAFYWHSWFSYGHFPHLTECIIYHPTPNDISFNCREGEITVTLKDTSHASPR